MASTCFLFDLLTQNCTHCWTVNTQLWAQFCQFLCSPFIGLHLSFSKERVFSDFPGVSSPDSREICIYIVRYVWPLGPHNQLPTFSWNKYSIIVWQQIITSEFWTNLYFLLFLSSLNLHHVMHMAELDILLFIDLRSHGIACANDTRNSLILSGHQLTVYKDGVSVCLTPWPNTTWGINGLYVPITMHHETKSRLGLKAGTWRQMLKQKPRRNTAFWLAPYDLFTLISYPTQAHLPRGGTTTVGRALLHQSGLKKMAPRLAHKSMLWRPAFHLLFPLPRRYTCDGLTRADLHRWF